MRRLCLVLIAFTAIFAAEAIATVLANVRGIVHDPQHRPIAGARATLKANASDFKLAAETNQSGLFEFPAVPAGQYTITVEAQGFANQTQALTVASGSYPVLHYQLGLQGNREQIQVSAEGSDVTPGSPRRSTLISREQIGSYAGVDSSTSLRIITQFVPGAYMVHDQLHVRGGHQVTWAIDGVPIPNTNIASNVGPQFNPKDIDYLEAQSGSFSADYGDRTYGVFNVVSRTGFERNRQAELVTSFGNFKSTDTQFSIGDHGEKFAYYASLNGNYSDYGLEPPTEANLHNQAYGGGAFTSLIYNASPNDQLRLLGGFRTDYYQVPNDQAAQDAGVRDHQREQDGYSTLTWVHTFSPMTLMTISPFYHFNRAAFEGGPNDVPRAIDNRTSNYAGGQASISAVRGRNNIRVGLYAFAQRDSTIFSVSDSTTEPPSLFRQSSQPGGNLEAIFAEDQCKVTNRMTLTAGVRLTHFEGLLSENAADPRAGVSIRIPHLNWVLRAAYSRFYQAPPLDTLSGPLLQYAAAQGTHFLPLHGERDEQHEFGLAIPISGWTADFAYFRTGAHNFFDHDMIGNSNIFFPLTIQAARIRGYEASLRSPQFWKSTHAHLVYSNQTVQGYGGITGGLTGFEPPPSGGYYLDHDQRNTLAAGIDCSFPWRSVVSVSFEYGSGFLAGDGPNHLPSHSTIDVSLAKSFGENFTIRASATNISNARYQLDTSNTFGGSHFADPRMISLQLRYLFHY